MQPKHTITIVAIVTAGIVAIVLLILHPWRHDDFRHGRGDRAEAQVQNDLPPAASGQPIDGQVQPTGPSAGAPPTQVVQQGVVAPGVVADPGQALTVVEPAQENVEVLQENAWLNGQVIRRDGDRAYVRYGDPAHPQNGWFDSGHFRSRR
jgi:hypothetical protein